jgi:hypothetical protein
VGRLRAKGARGGEGQGRSGLGVGAEPRVGRACLSVARAMPLTEHEAKGCSSLTSRLRRASRPPICTACTSYRACLCSATIRLSRCTLGIDCSCTYLEGRGERGVRAQGCGGRGVERVCGGGGAVGEGAVEAGGAVEAARIVGAGVGGGLGVGRGARVGEGRWGGGRGGAGRPGGGAGAAAHECVMWDSSPRCTRLSAFVK